MGKPIDGNISRSALERVFGEEVSAPSRALHPLSRIREGYGCRNGRRPCGGRACGRCFRVSTGTVMAPSPAPRFRRPRAIHLDFTSQRYLIRDADRSEARDAGEADTLMRMIVPTARYALGASP